MTPENAQKAFIQSTVDRFGATSVSDIPVSPGVHFGPKEDDERSRDRPYREPVGSLTWLSTITKLDIPRVVHAVARHSHNPTGSPF